MRKICRMLGLLRATTITGTMTRMTARRIHQRLSLLRKRSLEPLETIPDWRLSNAAVLSETVITSTIPTTQAGSWPSKRKKAMLPSCGGSPGQAPVKAASKPVAPTSPRMQVTATAAIETPMRRSRSVFEAKVRIQKPEIKKSLVRIATGRI